MELEALLQPGLGVTGWVVLELAEEGVAELLVEEAGGEGVEPEADAGVLAGEVLGAVHEGAAVALAAERVGDEVGLDEEPLTGDAGLETADGLAGFILEEQGEGGAVAGAGDGELISEDRREVSGVMAVELEDSGGQRIR